MDEYSSSVKRASYFLVLVFFVAAAGIIAAGYLSYVNFDRHHKAQEERQLHGIANLKISELTEWRNASIQSASVFYGNTAFSSLVKEYLEKPHDSDAAGRILSWLSKACEGSSYDRVSLLDQYGRVRLAVPDSTATISAVVEARAQEALKTGKVSFVDFHRNEHDGRVYLSVLVPVLDEGPGGAVIGVVSLRIDPGRYLYPYINRWPTPSGTAETLLVRREGGYAVFLNELRFQKNTALRLRIPLADESKPSVKAVLGQTGIVEGIDYRGEQVLAAVQPVPGTPWFLVARMDLDEVNKPMRERLWLTFFLAVILLVAAGAALGYFWRHQLVLFYRERYRKEQELRETEARFRAIYQQSPIAIELYDDEGILQGANPACLELFGVCGEEEIRGFSLFEDPNISDELKERLQQGMEVRYETRFDFAKVRELNLYRTSRQGTIWLDVLISPLRETAGQPGYLVQVQDITERKAAEEALRGQYSFLQQILDSIPLPIFFKDAKGKYLGCNKAFESNQGIKREDVLGKTVFDLASPDLARRYAHADEALLERPGSQVYETVVRYADGLAHDVIFSKATFNGSEGQVAGIVGCYLDITEKKRFEERLRESEEKYRLITETIMDIILTTDGEGTYTYISPSHEKFLGRGEEVLGRSVFEHIHPDDAGMVAESFQEAIVRKSQGGAEYRYLHPERGYIWLESRGISAEINGKITGVIASRDITDRKRAEDALIESEMQVRKKLDAILEPEGDIGTLELADIFDHQAVQSLMDEFHRLTGLGVAFIDLQGRVLVATGWQDICTKFHRVHPQTLEKCLESDLSLSAGVDPGAFKIYRCRNNLVDVATPIIVGGVHMGNLFTGQFFFEDEAPDVELFRLQARQYGFDEQEYLCALGRLPMFSRDTIDTGMKFYTKLAEMVSRLSYGNIKLARAFHERDALLHSLSEKNSELERFTYMISHDLKSPLVTVKTFLGYLVQDLEKGDQERVDSDMHYMRTATDKMSQLLDELLQMSRIGRLANPPVEVTFRELAAEAVDLVAGRISQRGVRVKIHDVDVELYGDRVRLGEVWQNLVENAVKFMGGQEDPSIEIGVYLTGQTPVFFVSDNGMGIEHRFQGKIFGLFEKLDAAGEGTGLGLALVKRIVEIYRGSITVKSEGRGKGARFLFTLPDAVRKIGNTA